MNFAPWVSAQLRERQPPLHPPVMRQRWRHLLFLHWRVAPDSIAKTLPPGLEPDLAEDAAWLGIVPFAMCGVRLRGWPALWPLSNFLELNLRTYVRDAQGRPGVWFYSLDANQPLAVWWARTFFSLPYYRARMQMRTSAGRTDFLSCRRGTRRWQTFVSVTRDTPAEAALGSLEFFLVERYRLFAWRPAQLLSGQVYHAPYRLQKVRVLTWSDELFPLAGFPAPGRPPDHTVFAPGVDVEIFPARAQVTAASRSLVQ